MSTAPTGSAGDAAPTAQDILIASLRRARHQLEEINASLTAQALSLQRERDDLTERLAEVTAQAATDAAKPQKKDKADE